MNYCLRPKNYYSFKHFFKKIIKWKRWFFDGTPYANNFCQESCRLTLTFLKHIKTHLCRIIGRSVVFRNRRTVQMMLFGWITSPQFDTVRPWWSWIRHDHSQQSFVRNIVRYSVLNILRWHYVFTMTNCYLSLTFPRVVRLTNSFLVTISTLISSTSFDVPRPVWLLFLREKNFSEKWTLFFFYSFWDRKNKCKQILFHLFKFFS